VSPINYVLTGMAGFVAPRHVKAIKETGGVLLAGLDPHDSVGFIDSFFPDCRYFSEFERFDRYCSKLEHEIDYVVVVSPNYLHDSHCRFGMRLGADVVCEKPVVLTQKNLYELQNMEEKTGCKVFTILQLRLSPALQELKNKIGNNHKVSLKYFTPRGIWYQYSWKFDEEKSGGIIFNIGIHMIDMLIWLFGGAFPKMPEITTKTAMGVSGFWELEKALVSFDLSIEKGAKRELMIDGEMVDFSKGFSNLHTTSYQSIIAGKGFGLDVALPSIQICEAIRGM